MATNQTKRRSKHIKAATGLFLSASTTCILLLLVACTLTTVDSFSPANSFTTPISKDFQDNYSQYSHSNMKPRCAVNDIEEKNNHIGDQESEQNTGMNIGFGEHTSLSRRKALGKAATIAATAATTMVTNVNPASAASASITVEPTKIELNVETDYLIRTLETFDGDMRKVLAAIVRSPFTTVQINPPNSNNDVAKDAILRALYSYEAPEDYVQQASWLGIQAQDNSFAGWLTKKRYKFTLPNIGAKVQSILQNQNEDRPLNNALKTTVTLSNLEAGVAAGVLSYPVAYANYQYEEYKSEQESIAKKAKMAAKKKAAAKKAKKGKAADAAPAAKKKKAVVAKKKDAPPPMKEKKAAPKTPTTDAVVTVPNTETQKNVPNGDAEALWRKLEAKVAQKREVIPEKADMVTTEPTLDSPKPAAPAPVVAAVTPAPAPVVLPVAATPAQTPVVAAAAPAPVAPSPLPPSPRAKQGNAGMDAYEAYLKQAYAAAATTVAEQEETSPSPPEVQLNPPESPKRSPSPFGNYLENL